MTPKGRGRSAAIILAGLAVVTAVIALAGTGISSDTLFAYRTAAAGAAAPEWAGLPLPHPPAWSPDLSPAPRWRPAWAVEVENRAGGRILLHRRGQASRTLGRVLRPASRFKPTSFYATAYLPGGTVVACARKVLRIRGPGEIAEPRDVNALRRRNGILQLNLLPQDWERGYDDPAERRGIKRERPEARSHIWTDCRDSLFGHWAPPAGSPVFYHDGRAWRPLGGGPGASATSVPRRLLLVAIRPDRWPRYVELENWTARTLEAWRRPGGSARSVPPDLPTRNGRALAAWDEAGRETTVLGSVYQRVEGIGRFDDTGMVGPSRIATNHPGDLAIATGPGVTTPINSENQRNILGGIQIVPLRHSWYGLGYGVGLPQWMIVGPVRDEPLREPLSDFLRGGAADEPGGLEGRAPLFAGYFSPRSVPAEERAANVPRQRRGYIVRISKDFGRTWTRIPRMAANTPQNKNSGFAAVTHLRIYLPTTPE